MESRLKPAVFSAAALTCLFALPLALSAQTAGSGSRRALITEKVNESKLHTLAGNTRPEANAANDRGRVADSFSVDHMLLALQRPAEQEQALRQLIDSLHDPKSASYHHWLTASQIGQVYGPAQSDLDAVTGWLGAHGFTVHSIYPSGMVVDFSGTAGQVREALHTEIHNLNVNGAAHIANMSDPQIPAALAPVVAGVVSLHDFTPHTMRRSHADFTFNYQGSSQQAVVPADLATIYNLNPLFSNGTTGMGQTITVIEDSDLYSVNDWATFRSAFGLNQYSGGSLTTVYPAPPSGRTNCSDPGVSNGDDGEAISDAEWASAAAPDAAIQVAVCADTRVTTGIFIALENLISASNPPAIMSISYGACETENGESGNLAFNAAYQQAVAEGISVFVAAGDGGAAVCDASNNAATHGIGVSAWASTPYNVAVGGTDFGDSYAGTNSSYWTATNSSNYGSATSYIPEIPWNDSCASSLLAVSMGYSTTFGPNGFCSSSTAVQNGLQTVAAGSGGPSGCATGSPEIAGVVGGTCQGYAKPSWQAGMPGVPNDGVRDLPDVSLFAGDGVWGHFYVTCWSNVRAGGARCTGDPSNWAGAGGTSFSSPIMAGVQALINQSTGSAQGNPNYVYYQLAASGSCNSSNGSGAGCIFNNVTLGDIDVNCGGTQNCFGASTTTTVGFGRRPPQGSGDGALSLDNQSYTPAYGAASGWNFSTGIGTINAYNLVTNWPGAQ
jgi:subtilase family serine protease